MNIQKEAKSQNIPLKIGIHQGEMVMVGADVLGDAVNIASRLKESAEQGCISISGAVYRDVKNKSGISTELIGEKSLKNVDEPVKVHSVFYKQQKQPALSNQQPATTSKTNRSTYYFVISTLPFSQIA
jgi:class 3 adenylate cyclase